MKRYLKDIKKLKDFKRVISFIYRKVAPILILNKEKGIVPLPKSIILNLSWQCNLRCVMCNVHEFIRTDLKELTIEDY